MGKCGVAFDLDGVLVNWFFLVESALEYTYGVKFGENRSYDCWEDIGLLEEQVWEQIRECYGRWQEYEVEPYAEELLCKLYEKTGDPIRIVTARPVWSASDTYACVNNVVRGKVPHVLCFADGGYESCGNGKLLYLKDYSWFVDDRLSTAEILAEDGKYVFVPKRKYNEGSKNNRIVYIDNLKWLINNIGLFV